ncbi:MAG: thiamine phosphate synthase [Muribaculaceae bacterium]|nr:thiamine phosphate synthase [Muribaculaceae bacterium]
MLQYTISPCEALGALEQAQMAVDAGCQWIDIDPDDIDPTELGRIVEMCKSAGVILVYHHHDRLLDEHRVHGVLLANNDAEPVELREKLGGHPIIGIVYSVKFSASTARRADADYLMLEDYPTLTTLSTIAEVRQALNEANLSLPIVVGGIIEPDTIASLIEAGASGINIDIRSLKGPDYMASLAQFIAVCNNL